VSSFLKEILNGVGSLVEKIAADDTPLSGVDETALHAELAARVEARDRTGKPDPGQGPIAALAGSSARAAELRRKAADAREQRIRGERARVQAAERKAQEEAFRKLREEAARQASAAGSRPGASSSGSSSSSSSGPRPGATPRGAKGDAIAQAYKTLDLAYGADFGAVKSAYRKLMRKYHPDLHNQTPQKQKAATELSMQVTHAYTTLEKHLQGK
jgi:DnaJ-domain-containing protein 1